MNLRSGGFLLIEATVAILIALLLSACMVLYQGKAALLRAQAAAHLQALHGALALLEGQSAGLPENLVISTHRVAIACVPVSEGIPLIISPISPCTQVCVHDARMPEQVCLLATWLGTSS